MSEFWDHQKIDGGSGYRQRPSQTHACARSPLLRGAFQLVGSMRYPPLVLIIAAALIGAFPLANAAEPYRVTAGEMEMLPPYCADKRWSGRSEPSAERRAHWRALLGSSWGGLHHYCWALVNVGRATLTPMEPRARRFLLEQALNDYRYTLDNSTDDFVLLPEIMTRVGEAQGMLGRQAEATAAYERAIKIKRDYWPAYERLALTFAEAKLPKRALEAAKRGLIEVPGQTRLMELFLRFGGDPKDPDLVAPAPAPAASGPVPEPQAAAGR
jgi:tetratricopeptide (TPR) repeat protein